MTQMRLIKQVLVMSIRKDLVTLKNEITSFIKITKFGQNDYEEIPIELRLILVLLMTSSLQDHMTLK